MLPEIMLDDVRFQQLVSEARTRIVQHSPDWTEHNVSDPGITLIELFAWLTEILVYRINRIPDRVQMVLLDLIGIQLSGPQQARVDVRIVFGASAPATIPAGSEVSSLRSSTSDVIVFQTDEDVTVPSVALSAYALERGGEMTTVAVRGGVASPDGPARTAFASPPKPGDAMLFGFEDPIAGLVLAVQLDGAGARRSDVQSSEPLVAWEAAGSDGEWYAAEVVSDRTSSLVPGGGTVIVEVPAQAAAAKLTSRAMHWLRCRVIEPGRAGSGSGFAEGPQIASVRASVAGVTVAAHHAAAVDEELIGVSEGISGTAYRLQRHPVLPLRAGETLEVRSRGSDGWQQWRPVRSFALSGPTDRHFQLDATTGEVRFGPAIRQPDGAWRRYGAVPPAGAWLRFSRYRHGGGAIGNIAPRTLSVLTPAIPGVAAVTNPRAAAGGVDAESLESARDRARLEIRSRSRAVTAEDFERLALAASKDVARAVCAEPTHGGPVRLHLLPQVAGPDRKLDVSELTPSASLMKTVAAALDRRRLIGTSIRLLPVRFKGVSVVVDVRASPLADIERVQQDVEHALYVYLNPLIGGSPTGPGSGWPYGRALNPGELFGIVYTIEGVEFVNILRMYETDIATGQQAAQPTESQLALAPDELIASGKHIVKAIHRE